MTSRATYEPQLTVRVFKQNFSSTPRGAWFARHLAVHQFCLWGISHRSELSDDALVLVGELVANAVTHGRVPGRDFELRLTHVPGRVVLIEVSDARGDKRPPGPGELPEPGPGDDHGRGLMIVEALADRWAVLDRVPLGKTVRAELDLPR
ncbi:ATP-binding protein [Streptomyces albipurpureus]|uniref:ATP-binding protein n=1 Tax=Streptomyces albipurpureus TaxID=2897419 RepID=A0ABT0UHP3_9ACTN|nr:ATP-binding protein [Streptomyces sp. CWNU-1]MCM2387963.1 ATP-binding protein [Streptomyces sp. CWNU-1]